MKDLEFLFRQAVDQQIALWDTLTKIEKQLGGEIDLLSDDVQTVAAGVNAGCEVDSETIADLQRQWADAVSVEA